MEYDNAKVILNEREELIKKSNDARIEAIKLLQDKLNMKRISRIEAFDNSHLFGTFYVGGMVVFDDFIPNKKEYRKYRIDASVKDDLSAMREVVYRRYYKALMEESILPDLIVADGGALQINAIKEVVTSLGLNIRVVGLSKDDKHKTNLLIDEDLSVVDIDKRSNLFVFLNKIQEEVHRYAISYHRTIKSKGMLSSILDLAPGIGDARKKALLKQFGSLKKIKEATTEELSEVLPNDVAINLYEYLKKLD